MRWRLTEGCWHKIRFDTKCTVVERERGTFKLSSFISSLALRGVTECLAWSFLSASLIYSSKKHGSMIWHREGAGGGRCREILNWSDDDQFYKSSARPATSQQYLRPARLAHLRRLSSWERKKCIVFTWWANNKVRPSLTNICVLDWPPPLHEYDR